MNESFFVFSPRRGRLDEEIPMRKWEIDPVAGRDAGTKGGLYNFHYEKSTELQIQNTFCCDSKTKGTGKPKAGGPGACAHVACSC